ncbi:hypothetical protein JTB14_010740 [Gonioctena quinquepunctata]|nr:hypothetical protein JTB14_010740 [Gonioctena quinquepunctata]
MITDWGMSGLRGHMFGDRLQRGVRYLGVEDREVRYSRVTDKVWLSAKRNQVVEGKENQVVEGKKTRWLSARRNQVVECKDKAGG